ncbi:cytosolic carboxypeptidase 2 [Rhinatrema bivittatum]|uniref:cytosolic carboxypeptidase 2 n=1 Tax=Rhinatrema bivittatum TaxID=194408 RepID=UPI00112CDCFD|nr:cytosolic carboxypeptidase 2 [Rhinatrema bivittatum]
MRPALETNVKLKLHPDPYENFMRHHLQYYGYFKGQNDFEEENVLSPQDWREEACLRKRSNRKKVSLQEKKNQIYTSLFGSKQLVFDQQDGKSVPRLREPRDLFTTFSLHGPLQSPRWPIECEVMMDAIYHIEWDPQQLEEFYQPTGKERPPQIIGENGTVVYQINPATKGSYFTCSQIGGSRPPGKSPAFTLWEQEDSVLQFESRFESGNLQKAVRVGPYEYELTLRTDLYTTKHTQWFYFQVRNTKKGILYRFSITNLMKPTSLYSLGMKPLLYSQKDAQTRNIGWRRVGDDISYYKVANTQEGAAFYCLTWKCEFPQDDDVCYFAHCYPYTYSDLTRYLLHMANDPVQSQFCKVRTLCKTLAGNTVFLLTITSPSQNPRISASKKAVVVTARVHPGETNGSWMMKGFLDFILSESPDARLLRDMFIFKVVPMLNPDGVIVGNYRCSLAGQDLNRNYMTILKDSFPCVWYTRSMITRLHAEHEILLYCDLHGHSRKNNVFMYGCSSPNHSRQNLKERVFPLMMSKNASDKFSFNNCKFKVQKCKEGTGRVVMWKMGIVNSYTMESTFGGSTLGNKKGTHFTTADFRSMGHHLCDTLLDYCDPDNSKVSLCFSELQNHLRQEIYEKLQKSGREIDPEANLSDISVSDIESSTSGSNSSESDGLPAHLVQITKKRKQKRKCLKSRKERNKLHFNSDFNGDFSRDFTGDFIQKTKSQEEKEIKKRLSFSAIHHCPVLPEGNRDQLSLSKNFRRNYFTAKVNQVELPYKEEIPVKTVKDIVVDEISWNNAYSYRIPLRPRTQNIEQYHSVITKKIQQARFPAVPKKSISSIKQHSAPFEILLDEELNRRQTVIDKLIKKEKTHHGGQILYIDGMRQPRPLGLQRKSDSMLPVIPGSIFIGSHSPDVVKINPDCIPSALQSDQHVFSPPSKPTNTE